MVNLVFSGTINDFTNCCIFLCRFVATAVLCSYCFYFVLFIASISVPPRKVYVFNSLLSIRKIVLFVCCLQGRLASAAVVPSAGGIGVVGFSPGLHTLHRCAVVADTRSHNCMRFLTVWVCAD